VRPKWCFFGTFRALHLVTVSWVLWKQFAEGTENLEVSAMFDKNLVDPREFKKI